MKPALWAALLVLGALAAGCATKPTPYGPIGPETPYGYRDRQNPDGGHAIAIVMPGAATPADLRGFFDRRATELCPTGVARTNVFRVERREYSAAPYVYGGFGIGSRVPAGTMLEGYAYCRPGASGPATAEPAS